MRAHKVSWVDRNGKTRAKFCGSQSDASATRASIVKSGEANRSDLQTSEVDIPTNKTELLAFINTLTM